jgi:hypothetical protein
LNLYLPEKTVSALKIYSQRYECSLGHLVDLCVRIVLGHSESAKRALKYEQDRYERSQASEEEWQDLSHELNHEIKEFASHLTEEEEWQDLNHEPEESGRQTTGETETAAPSPEPAEQPRATEEPETPQESSQRRSPLSLTRLPLRLRRMKSHHLRRSLLPGLRSQNLIPSSQTH